MSTPTPYGPQVTRVQLPRLPRLERGELVLSLGSCFAEGVGSRLLEAGHRVVVNPLGPLYNPHSVAHALCRSQSSELPPADSLVHENGLWKSLWYHSRIRGETLQALHDSILHHQKLIASALRGDLRWLLLTFGSSVVYETPEGEVVGNCHRVTGLRPRWISLEEMVEPWEPLLGELLGMHPALQVVLSVSPVRYGNEGVVRNSLNKALLLMGCHALCERFGERVRYFPAFEIVRDELRDYRWYAPDGRHPSPEATDYVYQRFLEATR